jgi:glycerol kinase
MTMSTGYTLAIDQGTHSTRAVIFDESGHVLAQDAKRISIHRFDPDRVEQDGEEILASVRTVIESVLNHSGIQPALVKQAGLASQRSSVIAWDRNSGQALSPVLSWQDQRSSAWLAQFAQFAPEIRKRTGLRLSPSYGAGKIHWLLANMPEVKNARNSSSLMIGPLVSYLIYHLVGNGEYLVDEVNASRTMLWNLNERQWDPWILDQFGIEKSLLPSAVPVCFNYGNLRDTAIALTAVNGDQSAALYANGNPDPDKLLVNIGTGAFVLLPLTRDKFLQLPESFPVLKGLSMSGVGEDQYYVEGTVNGAGAAIAWIEQHKAIQVNPETLKDWFGSVISPPLFVNTVGGLGTPWCQAGPEPVFVGHEIDDIEASSAYLSVIESILFLIQLNIDLVRPANSNIKGINLSGGVSRMDEFCQRLANLSCYRVFRANDPEATARGIAWQSAGCPDFWHSVAGEYFEPVTDQPLLQRYAEFRRIMQQLTVNKNVQDNF